MNKDKYNFPKVPKNTLNIYLQISETIYIFVSEVKKNKNMQIKFKAFDADPNLDGIIEKEEERMMDWDKLNQLDRDGIVHIMDILCGEEKYITPMQYSGIDDQDCVGIYAEDILYPIVKELGRHVVKLVPGCFCVYNDKGLWGTLERYKDVCETYKAPFKVIGNIFLI